MLVAGATGLGALMLGGILMRWGARTLSRNALAGWDNRVLIGASLTAIGLAILIADALIWGISI